MPLGAGLFDGYSLDLEQPPLGQGGRLDAGAVRGLAGEVLGIDGLNPLYKTK